MATFQLDEQQSEAIYLALRGDANEATLLKTKKMLELQRLPAAVMEVQEQLALLQGTGVENPGLLRIFNPQHDLLAETVTEDAAKKVKKADQRQRDAFEDKPEPPETPGITWADDVPTPRPAVGQLIVQPSGMSTSIQSVLGYDAERAAFRVFDVDKWDGFIFNYGHRDAAQWRLLGQALDYTDGSDMSVQPQGSLPAIAADLRRAAGELASGEPHLSDEDYAKRAGELLPLMGLVNNAVPPDYLRAIVLEETAGASDNAYALSRLLMQHAEMVVAAEEVAGTGASLEDGVHEAVRTGALADERDDDELTADEIAGHGVVEGDDDEDDEEGGDDDDDDDAAHEDREREAMENHDAEQDGAAPATSAATPGAPINSPMTGSKQRARNAAHAGVAKKTAPARKVGAKPGKATAKKSSGGKKGKK